MSFPLRRVADISGILLRYGFKELGALFGMPSEEIRGAEALASGQHRAIIASSKNRPQRLRQALEELGPTFVKLGQLLSTRPDLISPAYADEFRKLQDSVPPFSFARVQEVLQEEFGKPVHELFKRFDERPLASASLSQVHAAMLPDGTRVAVKIQRPGITKTIEADLNLLRSVAGLVSKRPSRQVVRPKEIVETFDLAIHQELDFQHEAEVIQQFHELYAQHPLLVIPHSYLEYSSPRVVTMDLIRGIKLNDPEKLEQAGYDLHAIAEHGLQAVLSQIFEHGFFHGDPHPGNVLVLPGERLAYVDFGLTGTLSRDQKRGMLKLLVSLIDQKPELTLDALGDLDVIKGTIDPDKLKPALEALFARYRNRPLGSIRFGALSNEVIKIMRDNHLRIPRDLMLLIKAIATSESVGSNLDPDFHLVTSAGPYLQNLLLDELKPQALFKKIREFSRKNFELLERTPESIGSALTKLKRGEVKVQVEHKGLRKLEKAIDIGTNQVAYALIIAALIVAGAMLAPLDGPMLFGLNSFSVLMFILAGLCGLVLLTSILRERKK